MSSQVRPVAGRWNCTAGTIPGTHCIVLQPNVTLVGTQVMQRG
jgi:hypothetical protein